MALIFPADFSPVASVQDDEPEGISPGEGVANLHWGSACRVWLEYLVMEPVEGEPGRETWIYAFENVGDGGYPAWLDYELDAVGWKQILGIESAILEGDDDESLDWLLREGILPGQPFCVELTPHYSTDYWTNECDIEIDVTIVGTKPHPTVKTPLKAADLLERAWALKERTASGEI